MCAASPWQGTPRPWMSEMCRGEIENARHGLCLTSYEIRAPITNPVWAWLDRESPARLAPPRCLLIWSLELGDHTLDAFRGIVHLGRWVKRRFCGRNIDRACVDTVLGCLFGSRLLGKSRPSTRSWLFLGRYFFLNHWIFIATIFNLLFGPIIVDIVIVKCCSVLVQVDGEDWGADGSEEGDKCEGSHSGVGGWV